MASNNRNYSILVGIKLDTSDVQKQLDEIKGSEIKFKVTVDGKKELDETVKAQREAEKAAKKAAKEQEKAAKEAAKAEKKALKEREKAQNDSLFSKFIKSGQLSLVVASWNSGLGELIANSQGIVIPSIWPTTTEYGFLEALSFGKPVIAFNISAHKEFLSDKINGYLSPIGDWERFGHNMDEINVLSDAHYSQLCNNVKLLYEGLTNYGGWIEYFKNC